MRERQELDAPLWPRKWSHFLTTFNKARDRVENMTVQQASINSDSVASILERDGEITIQNWLEMVEQSTELTRIPLSRHERTGHLPELFRHLIHRLRRGRGVATPISTAARDHGEIRRQQGYTAAMVVEESRFLQVTIFETLHRNLGSVDFSRVLPDIVTIADECDSQLKQAMLSYVP
jgi:RsbT co-antagonist protein rsbRD N-terminal domain